MDVHVCLGTHLIGSGTSHPNTYPVVSDVTLLPVSNGIVEDARLDSPVFSVTLKVSGDSRSSRLPESPVALDDISVVVSVDDRLQLR